MKIERHDATIELLEHFADRHDLIMVINERGPKLRQTLPRYYVYFKNSDIKESKTDRCLTSLFGSGETEDEAIREYAKLISEKLLVLNAMSETKRQEIDVPILR